MTDRLDKNTRAQLAQQLLNRFLDQLDIDERLAQIEQRLDEQANNIAEAHQNHDRLCIRVANLESQVSTVVNVQDAHDTRLDSLEGRTGAHNSLLARQREALANHDARLSDLEGEDRKVVLEGKEKYRAQLNVLWGICARAEDGYTNSTLTLPKIGNQLRAALADLERVMGG